MRHAARERSRTASSSSPPPARRTTAPATTADELPREVRERLEAWLDALLATPGLTALGGREAAWHQHVEDSLAAVSTIERFAGSLVDVGSGGGAPGIPLAAALPERPVTLLEANRRRCEFLRVAAAPFRNVAVLRGRAEEQAADGWAVAVAKALAPPPVALEWCLALARPGGAAILYVAGTVDLDQAAAVSDRLGGGPPELVPAGTGRSLLVAPKLAPTPPGFPRRTGVARKRPLA